MHLDHQTIFENFLAARRAKHGDLRMDATETATETPEKPADETEASAPTETPEVEEKDEKPALTAEQLAAELTRVRSEAANYRTKLRDAEAKLENAKTPEDIEAAVAEFKATNAKLVDRSERIVMEVAGASRDEARQVIAAAGGRVKLAIVMHRLGLSRDEAERALEDAGGVVRRVLPGAPPAVT